MKSDDSGERQDTKDTDNATSRYVDIDFIYFIYINYTI